MRDRCNINTRQKCIFYDKNNIQNKRNKYVNVEMKVKFKIY